MHGHLDLAPLLLAPGFRCSIGAAEHCVARLTHSALVQPEHCVIEVIGRKTMLTKWAHEATWLNDRLINEPRELIAGDRVAIGPFDFRLRSASADELTDDEPDQSALQHPRGNTTHKTASGNELNTDLITELSRQNSRESSASPPEPTACR